MNKSSEDKNLKIAYRNYLKIGDYIETEDGRFAKVEKLEYREVYTNIGVIKKKDIWNVYESL